jgi:N-acetylmuramic acid 6-phosphate etherase
MHPPDRSHLLTEQRNPRSTRLHELDAAALVAAIQEEDALIPAAMAAARPALTALIAACEPGFCAGGRLIYLGAGTSGRLGVLDASEAPPTFQVPAGRVVGIIAGGERSLRHSSEGREDEPDGAISELEALHLSPDDAVIGLAAGGTTPYVLGALDWAFRHRHAHQRPHHHGHGGHHLPPAAGAASGPLTALITCTPIDRPASVDHLVVLAVGPEVLTGSTRLKAGTATKQALNTISTALMVRAGKVYGNLMVDVRATNAKLRDRAARIVAILTGQPREACFALLDAAGGTVKTAVVMQRCALDREQAEARLAEVGGRLDRVLGAG